MEVQRLPRRLFYRWEETGEEIEYPTNLPDPAPSITCNTVQITVPPTLPGHFTAYALYYTGSWINMGTFLSYQIPSWQIIPSPGYPGLFTVRFLVVNWAGVRFAAVGREWCTNWYFTPGSTQQPRRDLLVGTDRIINPTINAPCPTWRIAGGNCPPNSLDCGNCCLDCAALDSAINGLTSAVLPYSTWRPR